MEVFKIGHFTNENDKTGVTVVLCESGAVGGVDVRGSAPGTRETDLLRGCKSVDKINAVCLAGGSAFGLDSCGGVMQYLAENGCGFDTGTRKVPIVCGAVVYDLDYGNAVPPTEKDGYAACKNATAAEKAESGSVGAGCGATVGKLFGVSNASKGGVGIVQTDFGGYLIGAVTVVNSFGDVFDLTDNGKIVAGAKQNGQFVDTSKFVLKNFVGGLSKGSNTTIGCVFTDAKITREQANKLAEIAQNGVALAISPAHTMFDGDTMFFMSSGEKEADFNKLTIAVTQVVRESILRAVTSVK